MLNMGSAFLILIAVYWPQLLMVIGVCVLLLFYFAWLEPFFVRKGFLKERFNRMSRADAAEFIDDLLNDRLGACEFDDFTCGNYSDVLVKEVSNYVAKIDVPRSGNLTEEQIINLAEFKSRLISTRQDVS